MYISRRKGTPGSVIELSPMFKEIKSLKKSLVLNGIKGVVTSGSGFTKLSVQLVTRN